MVGCELIIQKPLKLRFTTRVVVVVVVHFRTCVSFTSSGFPDGNQGAWSGARVGTKTSASGARETLATMMDAEGETEFWESPPEENPLRTVVFYADIRYHSSPRSVGIDVDPMCDVCFLTKNSKTLLLAALLVQAPFPR